MKSLLTIALLTFSSFTFALNHKNCEINKLKVDLSLDLSHAEVKAAKIAIEDELYAKGYKMALENSDGLEIKIEQFSEYYPDYLPGTVSTVEINNMTLNKKNKIEKLYKKTKEFFDDEEGAVKFLLKKIPACKIKA